MSSRVVMETGVDVELSQMSDFSWVSEKYSCLIVCFPLEIKPTAVFIPVKSGSSIRYDGKSQAQ